jgi:hypothetical protein
MEDQTAQQTKSTVVVVGDDILVRMTIAEYLRDLRFPRHRGGHRRRSGYTSATRLGNRHGVERRPPWRWYDGFAVAQWMRMHRPSVQVVLAGTPDRAANAAGSLCEEGPHLSKPYDPQIVLDRIKRLLAERK